MSIVIFLITIIVLSVLIGEIKYSIEKKKNSKKVTKYYFTKELFDQHIPWNGPASISRF